MSMDAELTPPELKGMDWGNDDLFFTHTYVDETSQFDPLGRWNYGCECYERTFACRVPVAFQECEELIDKFVNMMIDEYPDTKGFWVAVCEPGGLVPPPTINETLRKEG